MFKLFLALLICIALAAYGHANLVEHIREVHKKGNEHLKSVKTASSHSNLRMQSFSGIVPGAYLMETSFYNGVGCSGLDSEVTVFKAGACIGFDDKGATKYMKNECYMDTKQGQRTYYLDSDCTAPDTSFTADVIALDTCNWDFTLSCHADASVLNVFRNVEMVVGFGDATDVAGNNMQNAKMIFNGERLKAIVGIKPEHRIACNTNIAYGECVDTTNADSYARVALGFDSGALNLYGRNNGMGKVVRAPFPIPATEASGLHYTIRYPVRGWYDQYFGSGVSAARAAVDEDGDDEN